MVVNSISFLIFFSVVFLVYYFFASKSAKLQNLWLLISSFFFYWYAEWRMLPLLIISILTFYGLGRAIEHYNDKDEKKASWLTTLGVLLGVGVLFYFKYLNFFIESFSDFFNAIGLKTNIHTFSIIMPLGISYFTFKLIGYVIEVHRQHIEPCKDLIAFGVYIAFFPTIMSGPIDRPKQFLSQLGVKRDFNYAMAVDGCRQILWGMLKKMVVADNLANTVDIAWGDFSSHSGLSLIIILMIYAIQIYMDFSGYSDMAIGVGKILGIKVAINFNYPFFATNIAEFWRRWHMSLTSWITDYIFMPLNIKFRNLGVVGLILAITINLIAVGMWHGSNYMYALFGVYHSLLFIQLILSGSFAKKQNLKPGKFNLPSFKDTTKMVLTFCLFSFGTILFRATDIYQVTDYIAHIFSSDLPFFNLTLKGIGSGYKTLGFFVAVLIIILEWFAVLKKKEFALPKPSKGIFTNPIIKILYYSIIFIFIQFFAASSNQFIYFQF